MLTTLRAAVAAVLLAGFHLLALVLRARPEPPRGVLLVESTVPELFATVRGLAGAVGTRMPEEIRLVAQVHAAVNEDARLLGLRPGRRRLYLGVPLLQALTVSQLRAVVARELGHYARGYAGLGALTCRGQATIGRTLRQAGSRRLAGYLLRGYARLFFAVSMPVSRRMELAAERGAVRGAGRAAAAGALRELPIADTAWHSYLTSYVGWGAEAGCAPTDVFAGFGELLQARGPGSGEEPAVEPDPEASRWDPRAAIELVPQHTAVLATVEADAFDFGDRTRLPFAEDTVRVAQLMSQHDAEALYRAAAQVAGVGSAGLGTVLDLIGAGRRDELVAAVPGPVEPADAEIRFEALLGSAIGLGLVTAGAASWRHSWYERVVLLNRGGLRLALEPLLELASPQSVAELRGLLDALGVDLAAPASLATAAG